MKKVLSEFALQIALREFNQRYKTLWDLVEGLDDSQFLELRENPHFQALLKDIRLEEWSYDFFSPEESELKQAITKTDVQHEETLEEALEKKDNERSDLERRQAEEQREAEPRAKEQEEGRLRDKQANAEQKGREGKFLEEQKEFEEGESLYDLTAAVFKMRQHLNQKQKIADRDLSSPDLINSVRLNYQVLTEEEKRAINRIKERMTDYSLKQLLALSDSDYYRLDSVGEKTVTLLSSLRSRVEDEFQKIKNGDIDLFSCDECLLYPSNVENYLNEEEFPVILREDLDNFYLSLSPRERHIFSHRWTYAGAPHRSLEELGGEFGLTRERVRQIESEILKQLKKSLRFSEEDFKQLFLQHVKKDLRKIFVIPIEDDGFYYSFIGVLIGVNSLKRILLPALSPAVLGPIFAAGGAPQDRESLMEEFRTHEGTQSILEKEPEEFWELLLYFGIEELVKSGNLYSAGSDCFYPRNLSKTLAAATVLYDYPEGLAWEEASRKVNASGYSRTKLDMGRIDQTAFSNLEYTYLCGKGRYAHVRFANREEVDVEVLFAHIEDLFLIRDRETLHLTEVERYLEKLGAPINYYLLRYLVNLLSDDYGLYFDGRSQKDNISLYKNAPRIDQKSLIVKELEYAGRSLPIDEIAELLKSKSQNHASLYLEQLMKEGRVVHAEYGKYSVPSVAYKGIDVEKILPAIDAFLNQIDKPLDISAFSKLNKQLDNDLSNNFYASLVIKYSERYGWHRKGSLFSATPLKFNSLWEVLNIFYREGDNASMLVDKLMQKIELTLDKAKKVVYQWLYLRDKEEEI